MTHASGGRRVRLLWILFGVALAILLLKSFFGDVYPVTSGSMRPTLFGGVTPGADEAFTEYVFLRFTHHPLIERYDLAVIRPRAGGEPIVKRVLGLPGESVQISGGDVLIEGRRLAPDAERTVLVPLFDDRYDDVEKSFFDGAVARDPWRREGAEWALDATAVLPGYDGGMLLFDEGIDDGYLDEHHRRVHGNRQVNDAAIECEALLEPPGGRLRLQVSEEGDTFRALLHPVEEEGAGGYAVSLIRFNAATQSATEVEQKSEVLACEPLPFAPGAWHRLRFANIDNHLVFELDRDAYRLVVPYERNEPRRQPGATRHLAADRAGFGGEACRARFRSIRVLRDLFYTNAGKFAVQPDPPTPDARPQVILGPDEYFVLGDNSAASLDSRSFGPVTGTEIVGRPVAVVWPFARRRWL